MRKNLFAKLFAFLLSAIVTVSCSTVNSQSDPAIQPGAADNITANAAPGASSKRIVGY